MRLGPLEIGRRRDQAAIARAAEDRAMAKAMDAVSGAVLAEENVRKARASGLMPPMAMAGGMAGTSWSGMPSQSTALIARVGGNLAQAFGRTPVEVEQAMAAQGMTWGAPFTPGRPLEPFFGYRVPPRTFDYQVGVNTQVTPRSGRISFPTLKALWEAYDVAQICTKHIINDVRSLDYHFEAALGVRDDVSEDIVTARRFFDSPDKRQPFRAWLAEYLMDAIRYDAGCLYIRRNLAGEPIALEVVNGTTIIPNLDYYGRVATDEDDNDPRLSAEGIFHGAVTPAYTQIIEGFPATWLAADDIIYQPINPMPDSQYGIAPLEAVTFTANTDLRFQWHFLNYFTQGSVPAGFMEAPPDLSDPTQIAEWQSTWDALMIGDQAKLRQIRWVPAGSKYTAIGPGAEKFDDKFPLYLMRRTCAAHGVTPADLGFTETVNKATSEVQVDVQFRVGTLPVVRHVEDLLTLFLTEHLKLRVRIRFDTGREIEDRLSTAQAEAVYIDHGVISPDEPRARLGYPVSMTRPTPRYINNTRSGPVPLVALESLSGEVDPETFGPAKDAPLIDHPFVPIPGVMPPVGSTAAKNADNSTAAMQANMVAAASGEPPPFPDDETSSPPPRRPNVAGASDSDQGGAASKETTAGISAATGIAGVDLSSPTSLVPGPVEDDEEDDDERAAKVAMQLRQWRENARNRIRKGLPPRRFVSLDLPGDVSDAIWADLGSATTRAEVDRAFLGKVSARSEPGGSAAKSNADHTGSGMVSLDIAPGELPTVPGGVNDHHITVVFFGKDVSDDRFDDVCALAERVAAATPGPLTGTASGRGTFPPSESSDNKVPVFAVPDVAGLDDLRATFESLNASEHKEYKPHITLAYVDQGDPLPAPLAPTPLSFDYIAVHRGDEVRRYPFGRGGAAKAAPEPGDADAEAVRDALIAVLPPATVQDAIRAALEAPSPRDAALSALLGVRLALDAVIRALHALWSAIAPEPLAGGAMAQLSGATDPIADGLAHDILFEVADVIAAAVGAGSTEAETARAVEAAVAKRAQRVARYEQRRAHNAVALDDMRAAGVQKVAWIGGTCGRCQTNAAASPIGINDSWPDGPPPVHLRCGCRVAPA